MVLALPDWPQDTLLAPDRPRQPLRDQIGLLCAPKALSGYEQASQHVKAILVLGGPFQSV